jgi:hypothetical protein
VCIIFSAQNAVFITGFENPVFLTIPFANIISNLAPCFDFADPAQFIIKDVWFWVLVLNDLELMVLKLGDNALNLGNDQATQLDFL